MHRTMYVYPWDLQDEGVETVAARLRDAGLDGIAVATTYHAGKFVRPHAPGRKVYFPEDGTAYFQPEAGSYGRIKPVVNSEVERFNALRELAKHAPDLRRVAWTVGLHNTPMGMRYPDLVAKTAYGDPLFNSLCPSHPDVREYLVALCSDIAANQAPSELVIETPGWQAYRHGHHHEFELIEMTPRVEMLLGTCFCEACRDAAEAAGIDADGLAEETREALDAFFAEGTRPEVDPGNDPEWVTLRDWRAGVVTSLVSEVRAAMNPDVGLAVIPSVQSPNAQCWIEGSNLVQLAGAADRLEVLAYQTGVSNIAADVADVRATIGPEARAGFIMRPTYPNLRDADEVRDTVRVLTKAGAESISFYNYGHMRLQSLDWIKAAFA